MSKRKERRLIAGILSMLAVGIFGYPTMARAAEVQAAESKDVQTAQAAEAVSQHYATEPITVEAKRPDWEETLFFPGNVRIVTVYKNENRSAEIVYEKGVKKRERAL